MREVLPCHGSEAQPTSGAQFLPAEVARDPKFLARFNSEVRIGPQVSHPNVCRPVSYGLLFVLSSVLTEA